MLLFIQRCRMSVHLYEVKVASILHQIVCYIVLSVKLLYLIHLLVAIN